MTKTIALDRGRELALGFLYWLTFLVALEPGNVLNAGGGMSLLNELLRIVGAALLGALSAPAVLALMRRFPIDAGAALPGHLLVHGFGAALLALALVAASCVLAPLFGIGDTRPFLTALPSHLQANWLLLTFCILVFAGLAARTQRREEERPIAAAPAGEFLTSVEIKIAGRGQLLALRDVDWIETQGNYLALHSRAGTHLIRETMAQLETKIDPSSFVRIHRRTLVALDRVRRVDTLGSGDALAHLGDGAQLRVSRSFTKRLQAALQNLSGGN
jgi:hypothetical protein